VARNTLKAALVDNVDIMGTPVETGARCRLDLPAKEAILAALNAATH
jgi:hypothetical protein